MVEVVERVGSVAELHALDPFTDGPVTTPVLWWCRPTDDAIVLGSRQTTDSVDVAACRRAGLSVVQRRSGGGAVVMRRDSIVWLDLVAPTGGVLDDIRGSMEWIGGVWQTVLAPRSDRPLEVHRGDMTEGDWSDLVCFAGVGPGEVLVDGMKLVGLSQRRTRRGIRIQCLVYRASVAHEYRAVLAGPLPSDDPPGQAFLPDLDVAGVVADIGGLITPA